MPDDRITARTLALAAVGAPLVAGKALRSRISQTRDRVRRRVVDVAEETERQIEDWANEGGQFVQTIAGTRPVDEITSRIDFDRIEDRVAKARRQLENVVSAWRDGARRPEPSAESPPAGEGTRTGTARATGGAPTTERTTAGSTKATPKTASKAGAKTAGAKATATKATATKTAATRTAGTKTTATKTTKARQTSAAAPSDDLTA